MIFAHMIDKAFSVLAKAEAEIKLAEEVTKTEDRDGHIRQALWKAGYVFALAFDILDHAELTERSHDVLVKAGELQRKKK